MIASDFNLPDQDGKFHTLKAYRGKWVILYFYPKDDTPGCTKEACSFRDSVAEFQKLGVVILGVSKDSVTSHKKFADKYNLNFTLLSDESKKMIDAYHAWSRCTYVINPAGEIAKVYENVNPLVHSRQILSDLKTLAA